MRQWTCLAVVALGLGLFTSGWQFAPDDARAATILPTGVGSSGLITHVQELDGKALRVVVIDPAQHVMGVYDIGPENGEIQPRSIRNFHADLQMLEYNSGAPSPADIKNRLEQK